MESSAYARLKGRLGGSNFEFYMTKKRVVIGRKSKLGDVDVNMGYSRFISRRHLEIALDRDSFYFLCRGKNGIYLDDNFQRRENKRLELPTSCTIRFPSTEIEISFSSLLEGLGGLQPMHSPALPLKLDTQFVSPFVSPAPSPTGTISAVNSRPVSPNSEFKHRVPNFDLKAMAHYASSLLSNQQQQQRVEGAERASGVPIGPSTSSEACLPDTGETPPMGAATVEVQDTEEDEEEEEEDGEEEGEGLETNGEVPNDVIANKPEAGGGEGSGLVQDGVKLVSTERTHQKPPYSYAQLIVQALLSSKDRRQTLSSIYSFISEMYPYYKLEDKGWKNSIRHNLSLNQYFMKAPREKEGLGFGKGGYWCMHPDYEDKLTSQAYVKRKKKGIPVFPSAHLVSRSAPPSPTHHALHNDMVLESKFTLPPSATSSPFTLPPFFSQIPGTMNSSHSLPASPSRPPPSFTATPLKFFPMAPIRAATHTADDLALLKSHQQRKVCETIREVREESEEDGDHSAPPTEKRPRLENLHDASMVPQQQHNMAGMVPIPPGMAAMAAAAAAGPRMQFSSQPPAGSLQFLPISLVSSAQQPHPNLLGAPLSSFLPQSYFSRNPGGQVQAISALPSTALTTNQQPPVAAAAEVRNNAGNANEG